MSDPNKRFCQILLRQAKRDLTAKEVRHFNTNVSCLKMSGSRNYYFVEWPQMGINACTFRRDIEADNPDDAKAQFIVKWLESDAPDTRQRHLKYGFPGE